jgi:ornithine carbamoyltransferase
MHVRVAGPEGHLPRPDIVADAERIAAETGGSVLVTTSRQKAVAGSDVLATDTWVSMGQEEATATRQQLFGDYCIDSAAMASADPGAVVLHCLPAYRGKEIAAEVIDGPQSIVWDEAEDRLHAQKALLTWLLRQGST